MKKLLTFLICSLTFATLLRAEGDEFSITTMLSAPVGIFDTLATSGDTTFANAETGVRPWNSNLPGAAVVTPVLQRQDINIYGSAAVAGAPYIPINGTLQLGGVAGLDTAYNINNLYVYQDHYASTAGPLNAGRVEAFTLSAFGDINVPAADTAPVVVDGNVSGAVVAGTLSFAMGGNVNIFMPRRNLAYGVNYADGVAMRWGSPSRAHASASSVNDYQRWIPTGSPQDNCPGNNNDAEYRCTGSNSGCRDVRSFEAPVYRTAAGNGGGGLHVQRVMNRKECRYDAEQATCVMADNFNAASAGFVFEEGSTDIPPACNTVFSAAEFLDWYNTPGARGNICYALCNNGACVEPQSCSIRDVSTGADPRAGADLRPGEPTNLPGLPPTQCARTPWPLRSGLECSNAWQEEWYTIVTCGPGTGAEVSPGGKRYQMRTVVCKAADQAVVPERYLMLDK